MTARRALPLPQLTDASPSRWAAMSLGTPAVVALGFVAGWLLGKIVLRPLDVPAPETAGS